MQKKQKKCYNAYENIPKFVKTMTQKYEKINYEELDELELENFVGGKKKEEWKEWWKTVGDVIIDGVVDDEEDED